jgi:hypothetical protein
MFFIGGEPPVRDDSSLLKTGLPGTQKHRFWISFISLAMRG